MVEEDGVEGRIEPEDSPPPKRGLNTGRIVGIALAAVVGVGLIFGAMSWLSTAPERIDAQEKLALEKSWDDAQENKAEGVDFELELQSTDSASTFELSFDHSGLATATDGCYEATSDYIVLNEGSLVVRDLSSTWKRSDGGDCDQKSSELFWMSSLSYGDGSWSAKDARGSLLSPTLKEKDSSIPSME